VAFRPFVARSVALALIPVMIGGGLAHAQTGNFEIELNTAADVDGACRLTFVATNNTGLSLTRTAYEVAAFDAGGAVSQLMVLEFGELPQAKTRVIQFDLPGQQCSAISRLLVNGQDTCEAADGPKDVCMKSLSASSRIPSMPFGL
jgi:hypothetical protein